MVVRTGMVRDREADWQLHSDEQKAEIKRLRAALEQCAATFDSGPCTVFEGYAIAAAELRRRMEIAGTALFLSQSA